jgi:C1A family cysteine protease
MRKMAEHNQNNEHKSTVGLNEFSDWTEAEYKKLLGYKYIPRNSEAPLLDTSNLADEVNWVTKGAVTPVKNQGQCGSCWAFSTTGSVEGAMFLKTGKLQSFSESQLVDCSTQNSGCNGGLMDWAFAYIENSPLELESDYPYVARKKSCKYQSSKGVGQVHNY